MRLYVEMCSKYGIVLNLVFSGGGASCQGDHRLKLCILEWIISCIALLACVRLQLLGTVL